MTPEQQRAYEIGIEALSPYRTEPYGDIRLNPERASAKVVMALGGHGLTVAFVCSCGEPIGICHSCGQPRCWHCDPGLGKRHTPMTCNSQHTPERPSETSPGWTETATPEGLPILWKVVNNGGGPQVAAIVAAPDTEEKSNA
ncbi:hypothetical protein [Streptosporangium sp. G12]